MSREAFINDDIGFVTSLPFRWATAGRKTINKQVYEILAANATIYDGLPLYEATEHKNLTPIGVRPSKEAIQAMTKLMGMQTDPFGNAILLTPRFWIAPLGMGDELRELFSNPAYLDVNGMQMLNNPLYGRGYEVVEDATLNVLGNEISYYAMADAAQNPTIQIDYLNGNDMPTIRRSEKPGQLGFLWDIWLDWAVTVLDYRGTVKNPGDED